MFTGIIEDLGTIKKIEKENSNIHFTIESEISKELKIDQSVAHNGVCLTVVELSENRHKVTAIQETLDRTNLSEWEVNKKVNLERCTQMNGRLDGHVVQGHVDTVARCTKIEDFDGSWKYYFDYEPTKKEYVTVEKGSICTNGVSLTVVDSSEAGFLLLLYRLHLTTLLIMS